MLSYSYCEQVAISHKNKLKEGALIRRITERFPCSSNRNRPATEDKLDAEDALIALNNALWIGYKTLEYRNTKIVLEWRGSKFAGAVYQTFTGTPKSMKKLVIAAKANKITRNRESLDGDIIQGFTK